MVLKKIPFASPILLLGLSCLLSVILAALRIRASATVSYFFLIWNLFLAMIPLALAWLLYVFYLVRKRRVGILFIAMSILWLLFFPNAPYIVTDFLHLRERHQIPLWFDSILLFSFSWNGILGGHLSLRLMHLVIHSHFGRFSAWLFVLMACTLASVGVFLGRFLRWNSWDMLRSPLSILTDLQEQVRSPFSLSEDFTLVYVLTPMLILGYVSLIAFGQISEGELQTENAKLLAREKEVC